MSQFDPKKLGEEADELIRQQVEKPNADDTQEAKADETSDEVVEAVAEDGVEAIAQAESTTATDQGVSPDEASQEGEEQDKESPALAMMQEQLRAAEQRWKVLQGMITKKDDEISAMRELLASFKESPQEAPASNQTTESLVTDSDIEEYGKDYVDFVTRVATQAAHGVVTAFDGLSDINNRLKALEGSVAGVAQTSADTAQNIFFSTLDKSVPNWRALNTDDNFLAWLTHVDEFTGAKRMDLLQDAVANNDAARAAKFFAAYTGEVTPQEASEPAPQSAAPASRGKEKLVAPGKAKSTTPLPEAKRNWTRKQIAKLYDDKMAGRITQKEFDKAERDIFAAQLDGRIDSSAA